MAVRVVVTDAKSPSAKFWRETLALYKAASTTEKSYYPTINDDVYFANIPRAVWNYEIGGYPALKSGSAIGRRAAATVAH